MRALRCRAALFLAVLLPAGAQAAGVAKVQERDAVLATAVISDLDRFLGHVEAAAGTFNPGTLAPGMLKGMLAAQLGDPGLAGLGQGPVMGVMLPGAAGAPQFALFIPVRAQAPYAATFANRGLKTKTDAGLLAVAATQEVLDAAWGAQASYRALAKAPAVPHDLRLEFQAERLAATYGPLLQVALSSIMASSAAASPSPSGGPNMAQAKRILALELKGLLAVFNSTERMRWDLDVDAAALSGGMLLKFKPGTALAALATMPVSGPNPARGLVSGPGLMYSESRVDPKKLSDFLAQLLDEMAKDQETAEFATPEMRALVADMGRCFSGAAAYSLQPSAAWGSVETVMSVADENACLSMMDKGVQATMGPDSVFQKMYRDMGLAMNVGVVKKTRTHAGVAVHRMKMSMQPKAGPAARPSPDPLSTPMMAAMMRDTEFAFTHGYYVASQDPARLDTLIDLASAGPGTPADSGPALLADANMVVSYDFVALMKAAMAGLPDAKANPFASLPPSEPMQFAMTLRQGEVDSVWRMPLAPFAAMAKNAKAAKAEGAAPAGTPSPKPAVKKKP